MLILHKYIAWTAQKRWRSSLSHVTLSVPIYGLVFLNSLLISLPSPNAIAATFVVAWWWSREKTQHEYRVKVGERTYTVWHKGWLPLEWGRHSILDLALPAVVVVLFSILINLFTNLKASLTRGFFIYAGAAFPHSIISAKIKGMLDALELK